MGIRETREGTTTTVVDEESGSAAVVAGLVCRARAAILFFPTAQGGNAAGWAFYDLAGKGIAPKAIVFGKTNPVMVQGAVFAGITITEGWAENPTELFRTGDAVRVDPHRRTVELLKRA